MIFPANENVIEESDGFFRVQLKKAKYLYVPKEKHLLNFLQSSPHFLKKINDCKINDMTSM